MSTVVKDVVCGMNVAEESARAQGLVSHVRSGTYFFCGAPCKHAFDAQPARYAGTANEPIAPDGKTAERYSG